MDPAKIQKTQQPKPMKGEQVWQLVAMIGVLYHGLPPWTMETADSNFSDSPFSSLESNLDAIMAEAATKMPHKMEPIVSSSSDGEQHDETKMSRSVDSLNDSRLDLIQPNWLSQINGQSPNMSPLSFSSNESSYDGGPSLSSSPEANIKKN